MASLVFISYSSEDRAYVELLASHLRAAGVQVWYDRSIRAGEGWSERISAAIEECTHLLAVMTPAAGKSKWVTRELLHAERMDRTIIPLLLSGTAFFRLGDLQYVDVTDRRLPDIDELFSSRADTADEETPPGEATPAAAADVPPAGSADQDPEASGEAGDENLIRRRPLSFFVDSSYQNLLGAAGSINTVDRNFASIPAKEQRRLLRAFAAPPEWRVAESVVDQNRLVILRVAEGSGGTTAAICLAASQPDTRVVQIPSQLKLPELLHASPAWTARASYVYLLPKEAARLRPEDVRRLSALAFEIDARFILLVRPGTVTDDELGSLTVDLSQPDLIEVFHHHLIQESEFFLDDVTTNRILDRAKELLKPPASCADAAWLAGLVGRQPEHSFDADAVAEQWEARTVGGMLRWFRDLPNTEARCFAIALGVLSGADFDDLQQAARELHRRLDDSPTVPVKPLFGLNNAFAIDGAGPLGLVRAHLEHKTATTSYGTVLVEVVEFDDPRYAVWILQSLWSRSVAVRRPLIDWLRHLVTDGPNTVRTKAARAIGYFATMSFDYVFRSVLREWATGDEDSPRQAALNAFSVAVADDTARRHLDNIVKNWLEQNLSGGTITAALWYASRIVDTDREYLQSVFRRLSASDDNRVKQAVFRAMVELGAGGNRTERLSIFAVLADWVSDPARAEVAGSVFLRLAHAYCDELTELFVALTECRRSLPALWHVALDGTQSRSTALNTLHEWATESSRDDRASRAFISLISDVAAQERSTRQLLRSSIERWSTQSTRTLPAPFLSALSATLRGSPEDQRPSG